MQKISKISRVLRVLPQRDAAMLNTIVAYLHYVAVTGNRCPDLPIGATTESALGECTLPGEIAYAIFSLADPPTMRAIAQSCRYFRCIVAAILHKRLTMAGPLKYTMGPGQLSIIDENGPDGYAEFILSFGRQRGLILDIRDLPRDGPALLAKILLYPGLQFNSFHSRTICNPTVTIRRGIFNIFQVVNVKFCHCGKVACLYLDYSKINITWSSCEGYLSVRYQDYHEQHAVAILPGKFEEVAIFDFAQKMVTDESFDGSLGHLFGLLSLIYAPK